jgi:hypothetical protein
MPKSAIVRPLAILASAALGVGALISLPLIANAAPSGGVRITEWEYNGSEFVEFTNFSGAAVDLTGWSFSDSARTAGSVALGSLGTVAAGESFILSEVSADAFRTEWSLGSSVKVVGGNTQNLGRSDEINIYDASNVLVDRLTYNDQGTGTVKGPRTDVHSASLPESAIGANTASAAVLSSGADANSSWSSVGAHIGSPGKSQYGTVPTTPTPAPTATTPTPTPTTPTVPGPVASDVVINEVESNGDDTDWVELYNNGASAIDLSGYWMTDNHEFADSANAAWALPTGSILPAHGYLVVDQQNGSIPGFVYGLGGADEVTIWTPDRTGYIARYGYAAHAIVTWGRFPDGTGAFIDTAVSTQGAANIGSPVRINEVTSQGSPTDWVELINVSGSAVDLSGYVLKDNDNAHAITLPGGTSIAGNNGLLVVYVDNSTTWGSAAFGLGSNDSIRLFTPAAAQLLDSYAWTAHVNPSHGRVPDGLGNFALQTAATPGALNVAVEAPIETSPWPGGPDVSAIDAEDFFGGDLSGLDYEIGATPAQDGLWGIRNKLGALYRFAVAGDGWAIDQTWSLKYPNGTGEPDTEGMSFAGDTTEDGVYFATERNNAANGVSRPSVLRYDLPAGGALGSPVTVSATTEWNLAADFPGIGANAGLEGISFVPDDYLVAEGFVDPSTGVAYDPTHYPLHGDGLWVVAVEATKNAYVYVLNSDGTFAQVQEIESGLGVTADVQFDAERGSVWLVADDADADRHAEAVVIDGAFEVTAIHERPANAPLLANEGFAVSPQYTCVAGLKPVYWADDAETDGHALREGTIECTVPAAPVFVKGTPMITGSATVGATLTADAGSWSPTPESFTYQWFRNGVAIAGASSATYDVSSADYLTWLVVRVWASATGVSPADATSSARRIGAAAFVKGTPMITGSATVGATLSVDAGSWSPSPQSLTYQWLRNGVELVGETAATHLVTADDYGTWLVVRVWGTSTGYLTANAYSPARRVGAGVFVKGVPAITGTAAVGSTLTIDAGAWSPVPTSYTHQWFRNGVAISGATNATYDVTLDDRGTWLVVRVYGSSTGYLTANAYSPARRIS